MKTTSIAERPGSVRPTSPLGRLAPATAMTAAWRSSLLYQEKSVSVDLLLDVQSKTRRTVLRCLGASGSRRFGSGTG